MTKRNHVDTIDVFLCTELCILNSTKLPLAVSHPKHFDLASVGDIDIQSHRTRLFTGRWGNRRAPII